MTAPTLSAIVAGLPESTPFVGPEALERRHGIRLSTRLGANESLFGPSPAAIHAMRQAVDDIQLYGDPECFDLRRALAVHHHVSIDHLVLGSGIDELLGLFARAYANEGDPAVMSLGGYPTMAYQLAAHGIRIETVPYLDDRNDVRALLDLAAVSRARLLYIANPDNPTGSWLTQPELAQLLDRMPAGCLLMLDEAYAEFAPENSCAAVGDDDPRIVRFRTFSKAHGLAGLRVGYAMGAPGLIRPIDRIRNQFGIGRLAQAGALAALGDADHVAAVVSATASGRDVYARAAAEAGFRALPSATNFVAIDMGSRERARAMLAALQDRHGIFVRTPGTAPLDRCIRVTIGRPAEQAIFVRVFHELAAQLFDHPTSRS